MVELQAETCGEKCNGKTLDVIACLWITGLQKKDIDFLFPIHGFVEPAVRLTSRVGHDVIYL